MSQEATHCAPCQLRINDSWVDPGPLATILVSRISQSASQIICTLMEWECFLLTVQVYLRQRLYVQLITPLTLGKTALSATCSFMSAWSTTSYRNFIHLADIRTILSHPDPSAVPSGNVADVKKPSVVSPCKGHGQMGDSLQHRTLKPDPDLSTDFQGHSSWKSETVDDGHHRGTKNQRP